MSIRCRFGRFNQGTSTSLLHWLHLEAAYNSLPRLYSQGERGKSIESTRLSNERPFYSSRALSPGAVDVSPRLSTVIQWFSNFKMILEPVASIFASTIGHRLPACPLRQKLRLLLSIREVIKA